MCSTTQTELLLGNELRDSFYEHLSGNSKIQLSDKKVQDSNLPEEQRQGSFSQRTSGWFGDRFAGS